MSNTQAEESRPFSIGCPFIGEITGIKETTSRLSGLEQFELKIKVISHETPISIHDLAQEKLKEMCSFLNNPTVSGAWYPSRNEGDVDKNKVLVKGAVIKGEIDSLDKTISKVSLIKEGVEKQENRDINRFFTQNLWVIWLAILWTLPWKGWALYKSARLNDKIWFVVMLLVNTLGILEILYIFIFSKKRKDAT